MMEEWEGGRIKMKKQKWKEVFQVETENVLSLNHFLESRPELF